MQQPHSLDKSVCTSVHPYNALLPPKMSLTYNVCFLVFSYNSTILNKDKITAYCSFVIPSILNFNVALRIDTIVL